MAGVSKSLTDSEGLALQVSLHKKSSDAYGLVPFIINPIVQQSIGQLLKIGLHALSIYASKNLFPNENASIKNSTQLSAYDTKGAVLTGSIYAETVQITQIINNIGGVESIEFMPPQSLSVDPVKINAETRNYVHEIDNERYPCDPQEIVGYVTNLYPNRLLAQIKLSSGRYVKVGLDEATFRFVRYKTNQGEPLIFEGVPIITLGRNSSGYQDFQEFEADSVKRVSTHNN